MGRRVMDFRVLGPVEVVEEATPLTLGGPMPRALLALLIVSAGRPVSLPRLAEELWGDDPPATAQSSLHVHLAKLRRALGARLRTTPAGYVLDAAPEEVDAVRFERAIAARRERADDPGVTSMLLGEALALWRGPALDGIRLGPACAAAAARLDELRLTALEDRVEADLALGRHSALAAELRGLVEAHPARERLAGQLMLALHRCGRAADALAAYDRLCATLEEELGVDPGDEPAALARAIRRGDPTLALAGPAGLPLPTTSFVGRSAELDTLRDLLGRARLLTLVGPGGCGKSRLGLELARAVAPDHPGGVFLVGLEGLAVTDSAARAVAAVLDARERPAEPLVAAIAGRLAGRRSLVLLDNCEHLAAQCARLATTMLETAPGCRLLSTSREPLGVPGEVVYRVQGLGDEDAVRLLGERAAAARPGHRLGPADRDDALATCRHLDGLPLAIELVAARLRSLSLGELAAHVARHLDLLGGPGAGHERHRTMRAAIDWSHQLLDDPERALFRRLAVFSGGFGAAAAETVATLEPAVDQPLAVLAQLVDRSLVEVALAGGQPARYRLLEVVRQYVSERLSAAGEEMATRSAHADWFAALAAGARGWGGDQQQAWLHRIERDLDNLRAALAWYLGDGWAPERALQAVVDMWWVWYVRGMIGESRTWLSRALAASTGTTSIRASALLGAAAAARGMGGFAEAAELGRQALEVQRALGDERGQAAALNSLCISATALGDLAAAVEHAEASLRIIERVGDERGIAASRLNLGVVVRAGGDLERPPALFESAHRLFSELGDRRGCAAALCNLALLAHRRGEPERARLLALESLGVYTELGFVEGQADVLEVLAFQLAAADATRPALRLLAVADRARAGRGAPMFVPDERAARAAAEAAIEAALSPAERRRIVEEAAGTELDAVVRSLTEGAGGSRGQAPPAAPAARAP